MQILEELIVKKNNLVHHVRYGEKNYHYYIYITAVCITKKMKHVKFNTFNNYFHCYRIPTLPGGVISLHTGIKFYIKKIAFQHNCSIKKQSKKKVELGIIKKMKNTVQHLPYIKE